MSETKTKSIGFGKALKLYFTQLFNFKGRATRSEFWWVFLFNAILYVISAVITYLYDKWKVIDRFPDSAVIATVAITIIILLPFFASLLSFSIGVRRMHDVGKPGIFVGIFYFLWLMIVVVPLVYWFAQILECTYQNRIFNPDNDPFFDVEIIITLIGGFIGAILFIIYIVRALKPSAPANKWGEPKIEQ